LGANDAHTPTSKSSQKLELAIPNGEEGLAIAPGLENGWDSYSFIIGCTTNLSQSANSHSKSKGKGQQKHPAKGGKGTTKKERERERERENPRS
jgi:hypothetical protein